ncbi:Neurogenic locus notch-like protein 3, partial [Trichoplax sp. H2]
LADINECSTVNTCGDAARCINTNGSYYCQCRINYNSTTITLQDTTRQTDQHCKVQAYNGRMTIDRPYSNQLADSNALQYQVLSLSVVQALSSSMNQNSLTRANYLDSVVESFTQTINGMTSCHYILILRATSNITVVQLNTVAGSVVRIGNYNVTQSSLSDYNECENLTPCGQSEICNNTIGSYKCNCIAGYARNSSNGLCQANCPRSYCLNQGQCYYNNGKMACSCTASYTGDRCQNVRLSVVAIIGISLGSVVGVITIIALVAFAIKKCRSEKTAHITDDQDGKSTENMFMSSVLVGGSINRNYKNDDEKENEYEAVEPMI